VGTRESGRFWEKRIFLRFIAKKVCTACSRTNYKIVPHANLNSYLYSGKRGIKVNISNGSADSLLKATATIGELIAGECASVKEKSLIT
jgi:Na+-transporting NADH:ubiquinone oxidoreductase subunit NqrF